MSAKIKVRDWRPTQFDPPLDVPFPDFADWTVVRATMPGEGYPTVRAPSRVLTVRHWAARFYVVIRPPTLTRGETHEQPRTQA